MTEALRAMPYKKEHTKQVTKYCVRVFKRKYVQVGGS